MTATSRPGPAAAPARLAPAPCALPGKDAIRLNANVCPAQKGTAVACRVAAHATLRASAELIAQLRRQPWTVGPEPLSVAFLKHAEDQTVVALTAVQRALARAGWEGRSFTDWGVVAAPSFLGRIGIAQSVQRYAEEGAWGISPHLIPHQSLHAVSGTLSQALRIHGPNFGSGGGPNAGLDAFLLAATLLTDSRLPGLWLVLTGYEEEYVPSENGRPAPPPPVCAGAALALTGATGEEEGLCLRVGPDGAALPEFHLGALAEALAPGVRPSGRWRLGEAGWVELAWRPESTGGAG